jgi:hypothetical protein
MVKVLLSVLVVGVIATVAVFGVTGAWFTDIEVAPGGGGTNKLVAGTINLELTGDGIGIIEDLKPCEKQWGYIELRNAGENPGNAWLHITNLIGNENGINDAEGEAYWENSGFDPDALRYDNDIERFITFDLVRRVGEWDNPPGSVNDRIIIPQDAHQKMADLECQWIPLEEIAVGETVALALSFHLQDETGNEYQSDECIFDLEFLLQQSGAESPSPLYPSDWRVLRLENKQNYGKPAKPGDPIDPTWWTPVLYDGIYGILTYDCKGAQFRYSFEGYGLSDGVDYSLIYYADPYPGNNPGALIGSGTASSGRLSLSGPVELNTDMPNPSDWNYPDGAKIWLVTSADYNSTSNSMAGWTPASYLFNMRLITYNDTEVP